MIHKISRELKTNLTYIMDSGVRMKEDTKYTHLFCIVSLVILNCISKYLCTNNNNINTASAYYVDTAHVIFGGLYGILVLFLLKDNKIFHFLKFIVLEGLLVLCATLLVSIFQFSHKTQLLKKIICLLFTGAVYLYFYFAFYDIHTQPDKEKDINGSSHNS